MLTTYRLNLIHSTELQTCARTLCPTLNSISAFTVFNAFRTAYLQGLLPNTVKGVVLVNNSSNTIVKDCSKLHDKPIDY